MIVRSLPPHPSGRPVRRPVTKKREPVWNCPLEQAATPRLRKPEPPSRDSHAVGFYVQRGWVPGYDE